MSKLSAILAILMVLVLPLRAQKTPLQFRTGHNSAAIVDQGLVYMLVEKINTKNKKKNKAWIEVGSLTTGEIVKRIQLPEKYVSYTVLHLTVDQGKMYANYSDYKKGYERNFLVKYDLNTLQEEYFVSIPVGGMLTRAPIIYEDYLILANPNAVAFLSKETGETIYSEGAGSSTVSSSSAINNEVVFTSRFNGEVFCKDRRTKETLWSIDVGESAGVEPPLIDGNNVIIPSWSAHLYAINIATGNRVWTYERDDIKQSCGTGFEETPIPYGDILLVTHYVNGLFYLDKSTGKELFNISLPTGLIDNGKIYKDRYFVTSSAEFLNIIDIEKREIIAQEKYPTTLISGVQIDGQYAVVGNPDWGPTSNGNRMAGFNKYDNVVLAYDLDELIGQ